MGNTCCCKNDESGQLGNMAERASPEERKKFLLQECSKNKKTVIRIQARVRGMQARK